MRKKNLFLTVAGLVASGCIPFNASAAEATDSDTAVVPPPYRPFTLGLEAGTTGLGGSVSWRFADHLGARAGIDWLEYSDNGLAIKDLSYNAKIRVMSEPLTLDIYPWKASSFRISIGMMFNQNRLTGTATDTGTIIPPEKLGTLNLEVEQQPVNPYLSIGGNFFYFDHAHHWALGGELGVAYTGDPDVTLTRSGPPSRILDAAVQYEKQQVEDYANKFKWWPVAKLTVTYAF